MGRVGEALGVAVMASAPLFAGGVHRSVMVALMCAELLALAAACASLRLENRALRVDTVALPLALLAIPLLQSIPLPWLFRSILDHSGSALLSDSQAVIPRVFPLSLDPPSTRLAAGRAAAALACFMLASHLAAGQSRRHLFLRAIGLTGLAAVTIGLGHRLLGADKLYGTFNVPIQSLLVGPMVNRNHTAELLELSAFVCIACAWYRPTLLNRVGWLLGALLCLVGAVATLSRGSVLALTAGGGSLAVFWALTQDKTDAPSRRNTLLRTAAVLALIAASCLALGADELVSRFKSDSVSTDVRFKLWRDGLRVLSAHPFGIGRGAFERIFPIYRTLRMPYPIRFAFLENEPLQFLVDCGWFFFLPLVASFGVMVYRVLRHGRHDPTEIALCAGLIAVLAHSVVDFGLETLGVLLPFSAVAGSLMGRVRPTGTAEERRMPVVWGVAGLAGAGLIFGVISTVHRSADDFDRLLHQHRTPAAAREILVRAEQTHPLDYLYPLERARLEPLAGSPSPRLHVLNRALRLCPGCETVHVEVARNLWKIGLRRQALLEWRTAVDLQPTLLPALLGETFVNGATPVELASLASGNPARMLEVVDFIAHRGSLSDAFVVLDQADAVGASRTDTLLSRATLSLQAGNVEAAAAAAKAAAASGAQGPRLAIVQAQIVLRQQAAAGADQALAILDHAAAQFPTDLAVQRERVALVSTYKKWNSAARALEGLKLACYHATGSAAEAHIAAAGISSDMGRLNDALDEYRMALADRPNDVALWMAFGHAAEAAGRHVTARDAYGQAARLSPKDPVIMRALQNLDEFVARLRLLGDANPTQPSSER